jgi:rhodanese-related sulfurtransferase
MQQLAPEALNEWLNDAARPQPVLLDVRESWEFETCQLPASTHVPMNTIPQRFAELDPAAETVVICHHGARSMQVVFFLERQGFAKIFNLSGGVDAWAQTVDSTMARY